ncbi:MAG: ribonuclease HII [Nitrososphaerota archaeon]|nr:ribonuclease HII [Candidatus Calditenuis fumarioli]
MIVAGIDEAGRGAAIGPMVIAIFAVEESLIAELRKIGVRDSKALTRSRRERLFEELGRVNAKVAYRVVEPRTIDSSVRSRGGRGLNALEVDLFRELILEVRPDKVYIDSPYRNPRRVLELLGELTGTTVLCEVRADARYEVVAAASVIAKVTRDRFVAPLGAGSGYPSDPRTIRYLREVARSGAVPEHVRRSWKAFARALTLDDFRAERR